MASTPPAPVLGGLVEATSPMKRVSVELVARIRRIIRIRLKRLVRISMGLEVTISAVKAYGKNMEALVWP